MFRCKGRVGNGIERKFRKNVNQYLFFFKWLIDLLVVFLSKNKEYEFPEICCLCISVTSLCNVMQYVYTIDKENTGVLLGLIILLVKLVTLV